MPRDVPDMERIVNQYGDDILRLCYFYLKDRHTAEDALQDIFVRIYRKYRTLNKAASEKAWILSIAVNVCKNYLRTSWFKRVILVNKIDYTSYDNWKDSNSAFDKDDDELLKEVMNLKPIYKEVILLYYYQHLKTGEIAKILKTKESTVTVRLNRAREKLRKQLERWSGDEKT